MNTLKLKTSLEKINELQSSEEDFFEIAKSLSTQNPGIIETFEKLCRETNDANSLRNQVRSAESSLVSKANSTIRNIRISQFSKSGLAIEKTLQATNLLIADETLLSLENFIHSVDVQIDSPTLRSSIELIKNAQLFIINHEKILATLKTLNETTARELDSTAPSLTIYFPEEITLEAYGKKIQALNAIIEIAANILNMSAVQADVKIEKIESGSWFAKISANQLVIILATALITNGSIFLFNHLDPSKDISNIKESSETLERILNIRNTLKENNIDTSGIDENIKSAAISISKNLKDLIGESKSIEINDTLHTAPDSKLLSMNSQNVLENRSSQLNTPKSDQD